MIKMIVTGTIGSGKSTVREMLQRHMGKDVQFIDIDDIINDLYEEPMFQQLIVDIFGTAVKHEVSTLAFQDEKKRERLNDIVRSFVDRDLIGIVNYAGHIVLEIPLFFEMCMVQQSVAKALRKNFYVLTVSTSDRQARYDRVKERCKVKHPHWTEDQIQQVFNSQLPDTIKEGLADAVMFNDGDLADLERKVVSFVERETPYMNGAQSAYIDSYTMGCDNTIIPDDLFRAVTYMYCERHRKYHNSEHITKMASDLLESDSKFKNDLALQLAILFHDVVYDPKASDNEEKSVEMMFKIVNMLCPEIMRDHPEAIEEAGFMILCTKKHVIPESPEADEMYGEFPDLKEKTAIFLDLDLGIFVVDSMYQLMDYEDGIRKEYDFVEDEKYYPARIAILKDFAAREKIYNSGFYGEDADVRAKSNLYNLIVTISRKDPS